MEKHELNYMDERIVDCGPGKMRGTMLGNSAARRFEQSRFDIPKWGQSRIAWMDDEQPCTGFRWTGGWS